MSVFAKNLTYYREKAGFSRQQLADAIGVSSVSIYNYENDKREPTGKILVKIVNTLGVSFDELYGSLRYKELFKYIKLLSPSCGVMVCYKAKWEDEEGEFTPEDEIQSVTILPLKQKFPNDPQTWQLELTPEQFVTIMRELTSDINRDIRAKFKQIAKGISVKTSTTPQVTQNSPVAPENTAVKTV